MLRRQAGSKGAPAPERVAVFLLYGNSFDQPVSPKSGGP